MEEESKNRSVLLVKDSQFLIERIKQKIEERGLNVWSAHSVEEALYYLDYEIEEKELIIIFLMQE